MLLSDIKNDLVLNNLQVKDNNYDDIFSLYKGNEEFARLSKNYPVTIESIKNDLKAIPLGMDIHNKYFISIYNCDNELVSVVDIINNYSDGNINDKDSVWIGLLQVDSNKQNKGYGSLIINTLINSFRNNNKKVIQIGVIKENYNAIKFWDKVGFEVFKEVDSENFNLVLMRNYID